MIKHICPFCKLEMNYDSEGRNHYYDCMNSSCVLNPFCRSHVAYLDNEMYFRHLLIDINNIYYKICCSYIANITYVEQLKLIVENGNYISNMYYLPISVFDVDNYTIPQNDDIDNIRNILEKLLKLRAFL
jgi:hypothetical protein